MEVAFLFNIYDRLADAIATGEVRGLGDVLPEPRDVLVEGDVLAEDEQECEHGDGKACAKMAGRYREGSEVAKDPDRAMAYLRKACDFGDRSACNDLAQTLARTARQERISRWWSPDRKRGAKPC
jgi:TPR repeat protein